MRPGVLLAIAVGGVLGACARVGLSEWLSPADPQITPNGLAFPWATLIVNVIGCLLIGIANPLVQSAASARLSTAGVETLRGFLVVGLLGGFTTFSALAAETWLVSGDLGVGVAAVYVAATLAAGLLAVALGAVLVQRWTSAESR